MSDDEYISELSTASRVLQFRSWLKTFRNLRDKIKEARPDMGGPYFAGVMGLLDDDPGTVHSFEGACGIVEGRLEQALEELEQLAALDRQQGGLR